MDDDPTVVGDDPLAEREAVHGERLDAVLLAQTVLEVVGDGLEVRLAGRRADDEEVGEGGNAAQVERDDVLGFLVRGDRGAELGKMFGVDGRSQFGFR
jgi:hypothetical protein